MTTKSGVFTCSNCGEKWCGFHMCSTLCRCEVCGLEWAGVHICDPAKRIRELAAENAEQGKHAEAIADMLDYAGARCENDSDIRAYRQTLAAYRAWKEGKK